MGIECPQCQCSSSVPMVKTKAEQGERRTRKCHRCGLQFTTIERVEASTTRKVQAPAGR